MNFTERLARDVAKAAQMTEAELEEAMQDSENKTICQMTAYSLAKKAAEGGTEALKMVRELAKWLPERKAPGSRSIPKVELRVVLPEENGA